jgi:hypothetical protein
MTGRKPLKSTAQVPKQVSKKQSITTRRALEASRNDNTTTDHTNSDEDSTMTNENDSNDIEYNLSPNENIVPLGKALEDTDDISLQVQFHNCVNYS